MLLGVLVAVVVIVLIATARIVAVKGLQAVKDADWRVARHEWDSYRAEAGDEFLAAANATGKPRGLRWSGVDWDRKLVFACGSEGELLALAAAVFRFEAIPGGGMEDVEAVANLRSGSALFVRRRGRWTTDGRAILNLEPDEAAARLAATPLVDEPPS